LQGESLSRFPTGSRHINFSKVINEAIYVCMAADPRVYFMVLGVPDVK